MSNTPLCHAADPYQESRVLHSELIIQSYFIHLLDHMEAANMLIIIFVFCLSTLRMANCDEELHLCRQSVAVGYTEEVPAQPEDYGVFEKDFKGLGIAGGYKTVRKTSLEDGFICWIYLLSWLYKIRCRRLRARRDDNRDDRRDDRRHDSTPEMESSTTQSL